MTLTYVFLSLKTLLPLLLLLLLLLLLEPMAEWETSVSGS